MRGEVLSLGGTTGVARLVIEGAAYDPEDEESVTLVVEDCRRDRKPVVKVVYRNRNGETIERRLRL